MSKFSPQTKARAWIATIQIANMEQAGLTKEEYENAEYLADIFVNAWNDSGKNRTSGIAVCISENGLYHAHMALYGNTTTLLNVSKILFHSHVEPQLGGKKELTEYLNKTGKYAEKNEKVLFTKGLEYIEDTQGTRSDLVDIAKYLEIGLTPNEIFEIEFRYRKFEKMIRNDFLARRISTTPLIKDMNNEYHFGESGTGKTNYFIEIAEKYSPDNIYFCTDTDVPKGGLDFYLDRGAPPILFLDELKGNIKFSQLLIILDKYSRTQTHCRYSNTYNLWTSVVLTSVYPPEIIFSKMVSEEYQDIDSYKQLLRRLNKIVFHYRFANGDFGTYAIPADEYKGYADLINLAITEAEKNGKQIMFSNSEMTKERADYYGKER